MTVFAGIVARRKSILVNDLDRQYLARAVSRFDGEKISEVSGQNFHFVKVDIGAFGAPGLLQAGNNVALLAGEPLLSEGDIHRPRDEDLRVLQQAIASRDFDIPARSTGTFCAAFYDFDAGELTLIADKFGARPIYFWIGEDFAVFATALRIIEGMAVVPKKLDVVGATEAACFGFPLSDRTPFVGVKTIRESEVVVIDERSTERRQYWRWDHLKPFAGSIAEAARVAHERFIEAVQRRLGSDAAVAAFLTGGLDSRAIVATLRHLGVSVQTTNLTDHGSQDCVFGEQIAQALGCHHKPIVPAKASVGSVYSQREVMGYLKSEMKSSSLPVRQGLIWGGDGGSVGMGHVYLTQKMAELMSAGSRDAAVTEFLAHNSIAVPTKMLSSKAAKKLSHVLSEGVHAELDRLNCVDAARGLHLFLMFNDQRRHFVEIYENIDLDRVELQLPFFDARFMEIVLSLPLDSCLRHVFYMRWLGEFSPTVLNIPWQAYPGHVPCPVTLPKNLSYQWSREKEREAKQARIMASNYRVLALSQRKVPSDIFSRKMLSLAYLLTYSGVRDFSYALKFACVILKYWKLCDETGSSETQDII